MIRAELQSFILNLSEPQIRALACQNGIKTWLMDSVGTLCCALLQLDIIKGVETNETA
jgi:hypothetical protein